MNLSHTDGATASKRKSSSIFDEVVDRKNTNSMKWAIGRKLLTADEFAADPLPMWVADMDFRTPQPVIDALHEAVNHGIFGYPGGATDSYVKAVVDWQAKRFGWNIAPEWVIQTPGIITTMKIAMQAFSAPGDSILIQPPVYSHFHDDVLLNGRRLVYAPLQRTESGYRFDEKIFEAAIQGNTKIFIMSHPHNPTGNVWSEGELRTMGKICLRHGVLVISDEIHEDLMINPAKRHIPFASLSAEFAQQSITCTAPSKTFNLPGLQSANVFVPNRRLREELQRQYERNMFPLVNTLGMVAAEAAYAHGEAWLEEMLAYLRGNHARFRDAVNRATLKNQSAARGCALLGVDGLPRPRPGCAGARQVHADPGAAVARQGAEVRHRRPRLHARESRLPACHGRRSDPPYHSGRRGALSAARCMSGRAATPATG